MTEQMPQIDPAMVPPSAREGLGDLVAWTRRMRAEHPVYRDPFGMYHVFGYDDVQSVLGDPVTFSSDSSYVMPSAAAELTSGMLAVMDPPQHTSVRRIASQAFTPRRVKNLNERIGEIAEELLDALPGDEFDFVQAFSQQLPINVVAELLGIPKEDLPLFLGWTERLLAVSAPNPNDEQEVETSIEEAYMGPFMEMQSYMHGLCARLREEPGDGFISDLIQAEVEGERLADHQVANLAIQLVQAGHITATSVLGSAVLTLAADPELERRLRADHALIPDAVEEILRTQPPAPRIQRFTTVDTEIGGVPIPARSMVLQWLISANHDERVFADPERFDAARKPNRHVTFGHGIHYCFGAMLAKTEARIGLEALFRRFAAIEVDPGARIEFYEGEMYTVRSVPVTVKRA
ncbi:cytochrome P450 [Nocardiopsis sp. CNT-189]|uniref:cytochrome P450 n=1 Tax=Nocardiopsis oceanisediminis TaxID=2816862 RepID=UPI003B323267